METSFKTRIRDATVHAHDNYLKGRLIDSQLRLIGIKYLRSGETSGETMKYCVKATNAEHSTYRNGFSKCRSRTGMKSPRHDTLLSLSKKKKKK